jgi:hypothetical protein
MTIATATDSEVLNHPMKAPPPEPGVFGPCLPKLAAMLLLNSGRDNCGMSGHDRVTSRQNSVISREKT